MTNFALGFALIPDRDGIEYVVRLNERINEVYSSQFILKPYGNLLPHVSLTQGQFPEKSYRDVAEAFQNIYEGDRRVWRIKPIGINVWATKIFFLDISREEDLHKLHHKIVDTMFGLKDKNAGPADPQAFTGISPLEEESLRKYANPFVKGAWRPHFTIGRSEKLDGGEHEFAKQLEHEMPMPEYFNFDRLVIFDVGMYGRLERIKEEFSLI